METWRVAPPSLRSTLWEGLPSISETARSTSLLITIIPAMPTTPSTRATGGGEAIGDPDGEDGVAAGGRGGDMVMDGVLTDGVGVVGFGVVPLAGDWGPGAWVRCCTAAVTWVTTTLTTTRAMRVSMTIHNRFRSVTLPLGASPRRLNRC